ncbi:hypothetical protein FisN_18Hh030 [Fistulifera solaris]|uniref:Receptor expression-enhancing protein n=1 Tax=Fistulifera solaris TaxID=1519565 RepID=A0A1Z5JUW8_FISSO|nr:hypothetical protein FisN_18Hh030 [Fistulifera solaris]|eukprot:GAX17830.1 hypothetical protein FisN_18Hh030 [Fistulifera solaris]
MVPVQIEKYVNAIGDFMDKHPTTTMNDKLKDLEHKTGYHKVYFFVTGAVSALSALWLLGGVKLLVDLLGFVYPAYMSFKSMDSGSHDDTQWLTYWVVFSFLSIVENLLSVIVTAIPFYFWIKMGVIVWMYAPSTRGAEVLYQQGLRPLLAPYLEAGKKD